jgi:hypothetical protein
MAPPEIKFKIFGLEGFGLDRSLAQSPKGLEEGLQVHHRTIKNPKTAQLPLGYSQREAAEALGRIFSAQGEGSRRRIEGCANLFKPFSQVIFNNESTAKYTAKPEDPYFKPAEEKSVGVYAQTYARIYGANQCQEETSRNNFLNYLACYQYKNRAGEAPEFVNPERAQGALDFIQQYRPDIRQAAEILASHHQLKPDLAESLLIVVTFLEIMRINEIDVIQDVAACNWAGCQLDQSFQLELGEDYPDFHKQWGWQWASDLNHPYIPSGYIQDGIKAGIQARYGRIPISNQGFGPLQIILGNAMQAGRHSRVLSHYQGFLDTSDFIDEKSTLRAILDLSNNTNNQRYAKMFYVKAMMLDHVLTKLEPLFPRDLNSLPYSKQIPDKNVELQWKKLMTAQEVTAYPERQGEVINNFCSERYVNDYSSYLVVLDEVLNLGHPLGLKIHREGSGYFKDQFGFEPVNPKGICEEKIIK